MNKKLIIEINDIGNGKTDQKTSAENLSAIEIIGLGHYILKIGEKMLEEGFTKTTQNDLTP